MSRNQSGLLEVVDPVRDYSRRHDDEEATRHREEGPEVDDDGSPVDEIPDDDGGGEPQNEPGDRSRAVSPLDAGLDCRPYEQRGLEALSADCENGDPGDPHRRPALQGAVRRLAKLFGKRARVLSHPKDHPRDEAHGDERQRSADDLLSLKGQCGRAPRHEGPGARGNGDGHRHADPQIFEDVSASGLDKVGHQNADDKRRLDALSKSDDKGAEHGTPPRIGLGFAYLTISSGRSETLQRFFVKKSLKDPSLSIASRGPEATVRPRSRRRTRSASATASRRWVISRIVHGVFRRLARTLV